jgi:hypothetical protein
MGWTKHGDLRVVDHTRTGCPFFVMTDGYRPWQ